MAHFAELDEQGTVVRVVAVANEVIAQSGAEQEIDGVNFLEGLYGHRRWVQTSYNAHGLPAKRYRYAGIGFTFDASRNAFLEPQPFASWTLNEATCEWVPPVPRPADGGVYGWDESAKAWVPIPGRPTPKPDTPPVRPAERQ